MKSITLRGRRNAVVLATALVLGVGVVACSSSTGTGTSAATASTATVDMGSPPNSLDPQVLSELERLVNVR